MVFFRGQDARGLEAPRYACGDCDCGGGQGKSRRKAVRQTQPALPKTLTETVVDKNLFADDRSEYLPPEPEPEPEPEPAVAEKEPDPEPEPEIKPFEGFGKKVTLYGVVLYNDYKKALISNPERGRDAPKDIWVAKGDVVLEMKKRDQTTIVRVEDILEDRILVEDGSRQVRSHALRQGQPEKTAGHQKSQRAESRIAQEKPEKVKAADKSCSNEKEKGAETGPPKAVEKDNGGDSKYEVINTPFGEIKRRKK